VADGHVNAVHDVSDGGLLVALAEMALASGLGCSLEQIGDHFTAFGEDQARYIVTSAEADRIQAAGIPMHRIGSVGGDSVSGVPISDLREANKSFFRNWMEA
jgi:phosphoribosylformylglycinamidine synthase